MAPYQCECPNGWTGTRCHNGERAAGVGRLGRVLFLPPRRQRPLLCSPQPCAPRPASTTGAASVQTGATAARAGSEATVPGNLTPPRSEAASSVPRHFNYKTRRLLLFTGKGSQDTTASKPTPVNLMKRLLVKLSDIRATHRHL